MECCCVCAIGKTGLTMGLLWQVGHNNFSVMAWLQQKASFAFTEAELHFISSLASVVTAHCFSLDVYSSTASAKGFKF